MTSGLGCRRAYGGATSLDNTLLLCRFHHRLVHEEGFQLNRLPNGELEFRNRHGLLVPHVPAPPRQPIDPYEALLARLEDGAIVVDPYTGTPSWNGMPVDLGRAVEWYFDQTCPPPERGTHHVDERGRPRERPIERPWWSDDDTPPPLYEN